MAKHVFRYRTIAGQRAPILTIGVRLDAIWLPLDVYVDSGAAYSVLHAGVAEGVGFDYRRGQLLYLRTGDGSTIPSYVNTVELQIASERFAAQVAFSPRLGVGFNLLGRASVSSQFAVCFHERDGVFSFET